MNPVRALSVYLAAVFAGAATLSPWLYRAVQHLAPDSGIAHQPFHRYVNRCLLVGALLGLYPLIRALGIRSWASLGWVIPTREARRLTAGLALGFASLALAAAVPLIAGVRAAAMDAPPAEVVRHLVNATLSAAVVATLEELLFRGAVFGSLRRVHGFATAALASSGIYSLVHFFDRPAPPDAVGAWTGWSTLGAMLHGFTEVDRLIPGFLSLAVAGWLLAWCREQTGSLTVSIGLHAGWIFWLKSFGFLTRDTHSPGTSGFWGTAKLYDGWPAFVILLAVALMLWGRPRLPKEGSS